MTTSRAEQSHVLVLGTADWNQAIATNQHFMTRELAKAADVTFVESIGLRRPTLSTRDVRRAVQRLRGGSSTGAPRRSIPASVQIVSPKVIPIHTGVTRGLNSSLLQLSVSQWISSSARKVLWAYSPLTYGLEKFADAVVYHCVDLLREVDGIDERLIDLAETNLSRFANAAVASSPLVFDHLCSIGFRDPVLWENVADVSLISQRRPAEVHRARGRAVFAGNLSVTKVDFDLLASVIAAGWDLQIAGPIAEGGGKGAAQEVERLVSLGATYRGLLSPEQLSDLYWTAEVGLIPYVINSYTRGVSPLKTYEYLAAGLRIVSTAVPSVRAHLGDVLVADTAAGFLLELGAPGLDSSQGPRDAERAALAEAHSWVGRGSEARALLAHLNVGRPGAEP